MEDEMNSLDTGDRHHQVWHRRLNRPDVHNAFDDQLIGELTAELRARPGRTRAWSSLRQMARAFQPGGPQLDEADGTVFRTENLRDARALAGLMRVL